MINYFTNAWIKTSLVAGFLGLLLQPTSSMGADVPDIDKPEFTTRIFIANADASNMKPLVELPEFQSQGSPCWSRDGKLIAFDGWKPQQGESFSNSRVIIVNADGTNPRVFEDAAMPSFSPGGHRMVVSRPNAGGVWAVDVDGEGEDSFTLIDKQGWGADWSPDGRIAYAASSKGGHNLRVIDLVEGRVSFVFNEDEPPYSHIYWNMAWSPDGKRIAFKAKNRSEKLEIGIVDARGEKFGLVSRDEGELLESVAWTRDSSQVLFVKKSLERAHYQIFSAAADTKDAPKFLAGNDPERSYQDIAFSPDGKQLLVGCWKRTPTVKPEGK